MWSSAPSRVYSTTRPRTSTHRKGSLRSTTRTATLGYLRRAVGHQRDEVGEVRLVEKLALV
ncbi:MAG: hypothetical protein LC722_01640 [Actinobacteria bacterium]|nr:hypothetical protein [Actinomycetota bacterium]